MSQIYCRCVVSIQKPAGAELRTVDMLWFAPTTAVMVALQLPADIACRIRGVLRALHSNTGSVRLLK
jgi:hypothetical protein